MKTFEERYTAWIDGKLSGSELAGFERELDATAPPDKASAQQLGDLLRRHSDAPALPNADFFTHQIMHRIASENPEPQRRRSWSWSIPRLAWAGALSLLLAGALFKTIILPDVPKPVVDPYFAEIVDVRTFDPNISATPVYNPKDNVTVLWIEGLDYLPASYKLQ
ncbi:MAG: putative transrane anti-sigma factor [Chthoniobacteraceae bacterium]|nr:putative transrane anti-sigma factor [Chthoniobacteraceae bacterium]